MRTSDATQIYLASSSNGADLALFRLSDMFYGSGGGRYANHTTLPYMYERDIFNGAVKAMAWNPTHEGVLAVGGGTGDQIIRLYDLKANGKDVQHTIRCNNPITSLSWRKSAFRYS